MRVLFSSTGGEGHVQPMLPLAAALRDQGHHVLWAAPPEAHERVAAAGLEVRRSGRGVAWCGGEYARRWPEALHLPVEEATVHMYPRLFGAVAAPAAYPDLLEVARGFGPDLVVHEAAEYAAPAVAASLGVPSVAHGIGLGIRSALVEEACAFASTSTPTTWVDLCPPSLRPPDIPAPAGALPLRAATLERIPGEVLPEAVAQALTDAGDRPVVHVTFGTVYANPADLRRTAEAIAALGVLVIVSGRLDAAVPGVVVADYAPYSLLLRRCRAVVSQAGAGVMLKTLAAGVRSCVCPRRPPTSSATPLPARRPVPACAWWATRRLQRLSPRRPPADRGRVLRGGRPRRGRRDRRDAVPGRRGAHPGRGIGNDLAL